MKINKLLAFAVTTLMASASVEAAVPQKMHMQDYVSAVAKHVNATDRGWRTGESQSILHNGPARIVTSTDNVLGPSSYWGTTYTPTGEEWLYTCDFDYIEVGTEFSQPSISAATVTLYDANLKEYRKFTANFELQENETTINLVQVAPILTKKFFNIDGDYEVMLYVHCTTDDYVGHSYTQIYSLAKGDLIETIEGNCIGWVNTAQDPWSENFTIVFMREFTDLTDYSYYLYFDVYNKAGWSQGCKLMHTFEVDYSLVAGAGNNALPFLMNTRNNEVMFALPYYEKPYFVNSWEDDINPDNNFVIDLYDSNFNLVRTTKIPIELEEGAIFSFPGVGELNGNYDLTFGVYDDTDDPVYIVGVENYIVSFDDYTTSLYIHNADGERIGMIAEGVTDYLSLSDIDGQEQQYCFYYADEETGGHFELVNLPSCATSGVIDLMLDGSFVTTDIDRVAIGDSYYYVASVANGFVDSNGDIFHRIAWFDETGAFDHYDSINLGDDIALAQVYIASEAFNPYLFDTEDAIDYMFLVKEYVSPTETRVKECLRVYTKDSKLLLNLEPIDDGAEYLSTIMLYNADSTYPKLLVTYGSDDGYKLRSFDLPLTGFEVGDGTEANPYVISSAGQLRLIQQAPSACYVLGNDIDMQSVAWPGSNCDFTGTFDGQGHTISNIYLTKNSIFGNVSAGATIKDVNINNVRMIARDDVGVVTSMLNGGDRKGSSVVNVHVKGVEVIGEGDYTFGVIAGAANNFSNISDCSVKGANLLFGNTGIVGGIVGHLATSATVTNTAFDGNIEALIAGGIASETIRGDERITNCHAHVNITAHAIGGGILADSNRSIINNCYVDGVISAIGSKQAHAGGIVGELKSTFDDIKEMVIEHCIVSAKVTANPNSASAVAHRIAGFTSGDEMLVDWESNDPNVDWTDPSTYPYVAGEKEKALANNYAYLVDRVDATVDDITTSAEGKSMTRDQFTEDFMSQHGWLFGTSASAPWKYAGSLLALYHESFALSVDMPKINILSENQLPLTLTFTCDSRYAEYMTIALDNVGVMEITDQTLTDDGYSVKVTVDYITDGDCKVIATLGEESVTSEISVKMTSIVDIHESNATLAYDGISVISDGKICVYDVTGRLVIEGNDHVTTTSLPAGAYIAVCGNNAIKFVK